MVDLIIYPILMIVFTSYLWFFFQISIH